MAKSHMNHSFSRIPSAEIPRSSFDRSHTLKSTFDAGWLVPIYVDEALPGDTFNLSMTGFARLATPLKPVMDNMFMETFFFFVPNRLIWDNWQKFNGEQVDPGDSTDFTVPTKAPSSAYSSGSLQDYLQFPTRKTGLVHNVMHERAYHVIYNEWFRDQNLQDSLPEDKGDSATSAHNLLRRGKRHDYFTSALPWPQKGDEVQLPLGSVAPVIGIGHTGKIYGTGPIDVWETDAADTITYTDAIRFDTDPLTYMEGSDSIDGTPQIYADLSAATAATINELRQAFQVQRLQERDARGGTRYTEIIRAHFGVISPDARLQRPEFLGGGSSMINIQPVAQTTELVTTTPQGNLSGFGTVTLNNHGFTKSFTEHGVLLGLVNVRADLTYQQCLDRQTTRLTRFDYYWPALSQIGEQTILQKEIEAVGDTGSPGDDEIVFGYQERYGEYRYKQSKITGLFKSNAIGTLDPWHLAQDFANPPVLDSDFIEDDPPLDRIIAVADEPHFLFDAYFNLRCARPMPTFGTPGMIDHF